MKEMDINGRVTIPKTIRERNGFNASDMFEFYETSDGIVMKPVKNLYKIDDEQMSVLRNLYVMIKDTGLIDDTEVAIFKEICKFTDTPCPNCGEPLYLTANNSYKCMKCGK